MSYFEARDGADKVMVSVDFIPYVYYTKLSFGPNSGTTFYTTSQAAFANPASGTATQSPIEYCSTPINLSGLGFIQAVVTGDKLVTQFRYSESYFGFVGSRSGSCTIYLFAKHPGNSTPGRYFECRDGSDRVVFDDIRAPLRIISGTQSSTAMFDNLSTAPAGKSYGILLSTYGYMVNINNKGRAYAYKMAAVGGSTYGVRPLNVDVYNVDTGLDPEGFVYKNYTYNVVDVTGL